LNDIDQLVEQDPYVKEAKQRIQENYSKMRHECNLDPGCGSCPNYLNGLCQFTRINNQLGEELESARRTIKAILLSEKEKKPIFTFQDEKGTIVIKGQSDPYCIIHTSNFMDELGKASMDCWTDDEKTHGVPLGQLIQIALKCRIETTDGWSENIQKTVQILQQTMNQLAGGSK